MWKCNVFVLQLIFILHITSEVSEGVPSTTKSKTTKLTSPTIQSTKPTNAPVIICPEPDHIVGAKYISLQQEHYKNDSIIKYKCQSKYIQTAGSLNRTCQSNGNWSGQPPVCTITCPKPDPIVGANYISLPEEHYKKDSIIKYKCQSKYIQTAGSLNRTCQSNGNWSGQPPVCTITCPKPDPVAGANNQSLGQEDYKKGSSIIYDCQGKYIQTAGNLNRTCQSNGNWSGQPPVCTITCRKPDPVVGANYQSLGQEDYKKGSSIIYDCQGKYIQTAGNLNRTCQSNGNWSGQPPVCTITCPKLDHVDGANNPSQEHYKKNSTVNYNCLSKYIQTAGNLTRTCQSNGRWSGQPPVCTITCPTPKTLDEATYTSLKPYKKDSTVKYNCNEKYIQTAGNLTRTCMSNGQWSGQQPVCTATCPSPEKADEHIDMKIPSKLIEGRTVTYTCQKHFSRISGDLERTCQSNHLWNGTKPVCKISAGASCFVEGSTDICVPNAECLDQLCKCKNKHFYYDNITVDGVLCSPVKNLGDECSAEGANKECFGKEECVLEGKRTVCRCSSQTFPNAKGLCEGRPTQPIITFLPSTSDTARFSASFGEDYRVNGLQVSYVETDGGNSTLVYLNESSSYTIQQLKAGTCYSFTFYSLIDKSTSANPTNVRHCNNPNPPTFVNVTDKGNDTAIVDVYPGSGNFQLYFILINGSFYVKSNSSVNYVDGLTPGNLYVIRVGTTSNGLNSTVYEVHYKTAPDIPESINITHQTSTTFDINIVHGRGLVQYFHIKINSSYTLQRHAAFGTFETTIKIPGLIPGTLYKDIEVEALSYNVSSDYYTVPTHATNPSEPSFEVTNSDNKSVSIDITKGPGQIEQYFVLVNSVYYDVSNESVVKITGLSPGYMYRISTGATSNGLNSTVHNLDVPTYPDIPKTVIITGQTTTSISMAIAHGGGQVQSFYIQVNTTYNFTEKASTEANKTTLEIPALVPGVLYDNIKVQAVSHNLESQFQSSPANATNPSQPSFEVTTTGNRSVSINITKGPGQLKEYFVLVNSIYRDVSAESVVDITGLTPGYLYKISTGASSNGLNSTVFSLDVPTYPERPLSASFVNQTTNTLTISIVHGDGKVEMFSIQGSNLLTVRGDASKDYKTTIVIPKLIPGTLYDHVNVQALSNKLESDKRFVKPHATNPAKPNSAVITNQSTTELNMKIVHGEGFVQIFVIQVNESYNMTANASRTPITIVSVPQLLPGKKYNSIKVFAVSYSLYSVGSAVKPHSTNPDVPRSVDVTNQTTATIDINIVHGAGEVQSFLIQVNEEASISRTASNGESTTIVIPDLIAGTLYDNMKVWSVSNNLRSTITAVHKHATNPAIPTVANIISQTTESMTMKIVHGKGKVQSFSIQVKDKNKLSYNATTGNSTVIVIPHLSPGTTYGKMKVMSVSYSLTSSSRAVSPHSTNPSIPSLVYMNSTTDEIGIQISKGAGGVQSYHIYLDDKPYKNITSVSTSNVTITGRKAGHMYKIVVFAIFNKLRSKASTTLQKATYPPVPKFKINGHASKEINMTVWKDDGVVQNYYTLVKSVNNSAGCSSQPKASKMEPINDPSNWVLVKDLIPGAKYRVSVISKSNSLESTSTSAIHVTEPSPAKFSYDESAHSITLTIKRGEGCVDHYDVYVNGVKKKTVKPPSQHKKTVTTEIKGLDDDADFKVSVVSVSYDVTSTKDPITASTKFDAVPVIGGTAGSLVALIIIFVVVCAKRKQIMCFRKSKPTEILDGKSNAGFDNDVVEMTDNRRQRPIKLADFSRHIEYMSRNSNMDFSKEFKELGSFSPKHPTNASQMQENRPKNRYTNILPFDHSIVKLIGAEDEPGSDYINANYIEGFRGPREYIAAQGPLPATLADFWRMVWEQNVCIIVMLTQIIERGRKKCEIYWPENTNEKRFFGDIIVEVETLSHLPEYALRTITLRLGDIEKKILHYNFLAWPDMGTPKTTNTMISFVETVRQDVRGNRNGPVLVHCSAGVGRTGTFIVMDILLQKLKSKMLSEVDIFGSILKMRESRVNMVQTEDQYIFIFECIRDFVEASDDEDEENLYENQQGNPIYENA